LSKILVCGDSYCIPDPSYPGLHWVEKILDHSPEFEVVNLSYGGSSNALIAFQLLQGLQLDPDFVILSFTDTSRYELDKDVGALPRSLNPDEISSYTKERYTTNNRHNELSSMQLKIIDQYRTIASSEVFEKLKNYFYLGFCLQTLRMSGIDFCFSLGGFEFQQDYTKLLRSNYIKNILVDYQQNELATNLWFYGREPSPWFHVKDENALTLFANECIDRIHHVKSKEKANC
jgi:hypothetical protein